MAKRLQALAGFAAALLTAQAAMAGDTITVGPGQFAASNPNDTSSNPANAKYLFITKTVHFVGAQAGIDGLTAFSRDQFVDLALGLARDGERRARASRCILEAHPEIFETIAAVDEFADWLETTARGGSWPGGTVARTLE